MQIRKNQQDEEAIDLFLMKNDLSEDFRNNEHLCMWRRDDTNLLQKYVIVPVECQNDEIIMKATSVFSCWQQMRNDDFYLIKAQCFGDEMDSKVKVIDIHSIERYASENGPKVC